MKYCDNLVDKVNEGSVSKIANVDIKYFQMDDLFDLNPGSTSEHLGALFEKYWIPKMKGACIFSGQIKTIIPDYLEKKHQAEKLENK